MPCGGCKKKKRRPPPSRGAPAGSLPSLTARLWNLSKAVAAFAKKPGFVSRPHYQARLRVCQACPKRAGKKRQRCSVCGCHIILKARGAAWSCPDDPDRWADIDAEFAQQSDRKPPEEQDLRRT